MTFAIFLCLFFEVTALSDRKGKFSAWSAFQFLSDLEDHVFFTGLFKVRITNRLASVCVCLFADLVSIIYIFTHCEHTFKIRLKTF